MFRTLIYPSSGACDYYVELPHWSYCSWFDVCWSFGVVGLEWYPCCRLKHKNKHSCASACNTDTTPTQPHRNSNTHRTKNNTTNVVIQQNSRKLLIMDIFMPETCWAHKKWNKIADDIKLVFRMIWENTPVSGKKVTDVSSHRNELLICVRPWHIDSFIWKKNFTIFCTYSNKKGIFTV